MLFKKCRLNNFKVVFTAILLVKASIVYTQIQINYQDAQNWNSGNYLVYKGGNHDWNEPKNLELIINSNSVWDFTNFSFDDTQKTVVRSLSAQEKTDFPDGTNLKFNSFSQYEYFSYSGLNVTDYNSRFYLIESTSPQYLVFTSVLDSVFGTSFGKPTVSVIKARSTYPDTIISFPLKMNDSTLSKFSIGENLTCIDLVKRKVNAYGYIVLPGKDTLKALGMYEYMVISGKPQQSYIWYTKEYGITARISTYVGPNNLDTTRIFEKGSHIIFGDESREYGISIHDFVLRIPDHGSSMIIEERRNNETRLALQNNTAGEKFFF